jgi:hypothetical protein
MLKRIYICDQCKKEFVEQNVLTMVKLETEPYSFYPKRTKVSWYKEICDECCEKIGIKFCKKEEVATGNQIQSLRDRLFEIFQEIVCSVQR